MSSSVRVYRLEAFDRGHQGMRVWFTRAYDAADADAQFEVFRRGTTDISGEPLFTRAARIQPVEGPTTETATFF